jgi:hypothetical protein
MTTCRYILLGALLEHLRAALGDLAERVASFAVVTLEDAVVERCRIVGEPPPTDLCAAADAERDHLRLLAERQRSEG